MAVSEFYRGGFNWRNLKGNPLTVEWDGTNEQDICDWINDTITNHPLVVNNPITFANRPLWTASVNGSTVTFTGWKGNIPMPSYQTVSVQVALNGWLSAWVPFVGQSSEGPGPVAVVGQAGMWQTQDPDGRPENVEDVFAPGTTFPW